MLKTTEPRKGKDGIGGDSRAGRGASKIDRSGMDDIEVDGGEVEVDGVGQKGRKMSKSKNLSESKKSIKPLNFFTFGAKLAFTKLRQAFLKALILHHFDPERHIQIDMDASGYAIVGVLSQLTSDGRWHSMAFISHKMIPVETRYETHDVELLAIVEAFKS